MPDYSNHTDGEIFVSYQHMGNAADDMVFQTQAIDRILQSLEEELAVLRQTWVGFDQSGYDAKQQAWNTALETMERNLMSHVGLLNDITESYKYSENMLSSMWENIKIG